MKSYATNSIRLVCFALIAMVFAAMPALGQDPGRLQISSLDKFAAKAVETVDVTLDESLLKLASKFLSEKRSPDEAKIKDVVAGLKGVYVKRFGFEKEGEYTEADVEAIRSQLNRPGWSKIVGVRSKKAGSTNVDVFIMYEGSLIKGLAVLATEPKALTVVNVVGPIDVEKLSELEGKFGIPSLELIKGKKDADKKDDASKEKPAEKKP
ncbi:MAG TPA: DUF4252 domain-containing protein [Blastocatellia bacterium]|nr:DUF4252 domain-containing protein [Blastocatellia bacterium]